MAVKINPKYIPYSKEETQAILEGVEHIDETPTEESNYPVSSGGVKTALNDHPTTAQMASAIAPLQVTEEQFNAIFGIDSSSSQ